MISWWTALSTRERQLIALAGLLVSAVTLVYGGLLPGIQAMRAADQRLALAASDHREIKIMAAELQHRRSAAAERQTGDVRTRLDSVASETGVQLLEASDVNSARVLRVRARSSAAVLDFAARAADSIGGGATSLTLSPGPDGLSAILTLSPPTS